MPTHTRVRRGHHHRSRSHWAQRTRTDGKYTTLTVCTPPSAREVTRCAPMRLLTSSVLDPSDTCTLPPMRAEGQARSGERGDLSGAMQRCDAPHVVLQRIVEINVGPHVQLHSQRRPHAAHAQLEAPSAQRAGPVGVLVQREGQAVAAVDLARLRRAGGRVRSDRLGKGGRAVGVRTLWCRVLNSRSRTSTHDCDGSVTCGEQGVSYRRKHRAAPPPHATGPSPPP